MKLEKYFHEFNYRYQIFWRFLNGEKTRYKSSDLTKMFYDRDFVETLKSIVGNDEEALLDFQELTYRFFIPYLTSLLPKGVGAEYSESIFSPYIFLTYKDYTIAWYDIYECEFHRLSMPGQAAIQERSEDLVAQIKDLNELKKDLLEKADPRSHHGADKLQYMVGQKSRLKKLSQDLHIINEKLNDLIKENAQLITTGNLIDQSYREFIDMQERLYQIMLKNFHCRLILERKDMLEAEDEKVVSLFQL